MTFNCERLDKLTENELWKIRENSFKNFHAKGLDYICLARKNYGFTKVYFFEGKIENASEVVNPHNHRYNFTTTVLNGRLKDYRFRINPDSNNRFNMFDWNTPLNGGDGFIFRNEVGLDKAEEVTLEKGCTPYRTHYAEIHTIQVAEPNTILLLQQQGDSLMPYEKTQTFFKDTLPPPLSGLYEKFKIEEIITRLKQIKELGAITHDQ